MAAGNEPKKKLLSWKFAKTYGNFKVVLFLYTLTHTHFEEPSGLLHQFSLLKKISIMSLN